MTTLLAAFVLINLVTGQPIRQFRSIDECVVASFHVSFSTGQETRCEPVYRVVK